MRSRFLAKASSACRSARVKKKLPHIVPKRNTPIITAGAHIGGAFRHSARCGEAMTISTRPPAAAFRGGGAFLISWKRSGEIP